jgi:hypothetical protein
MSTSLTIDRDKRDIALNYLTISARKLIDARGNYDEAISAIKTMHTYIKLAQQYGCTTAEMTLALGYDTQRTQSLLAQVN